MDVNCIVSKTICLADPTKKMILNEPLAYNNVRAHAMQVEVVDDEKMPVDLTGVSAVGSFLRADRVTIEPITGTVDGNIARVILPESCYLCEGWYTFTMNLVTIDGASRTVLWIEGMAERNTSDVKNDPGSPIGNVSQAVARATAAAEAAEQVVEDAQEILEEAGNSVQNVSELQILTSADKNASGNPIVVEDARNAPVKNVKITINPKINLHGYDHPWIGGSGKNKLPVTAQSDGIFTVNADSDGNVMSVVAKGNPDGTVIFGNSLYLAAGNYLLTGCPSGGSASTFNLSIRQESTTGTVVGNIDTGSGAEVTIPSDGTYYFAISVTSSSNVNKSFRPMLRLATVSDSTYEPYSNICHFEASDTALLDICGKNIFDIDHPYMSGKRISSSGEIIDAEGWNLYLLPTYKGVQLSASCLIPGSESGSGLAWLLYDADMNMYGYGGVSSVGTVVVGGGTPPSPAGTHPNATITPSRNGYMLFTFDEITYEECQIEYVLHHVANSPDYTEYVEYQSKKHQFDIEDIAGSAIYGGTLEINEDGSSELTVDRVMVQPTADDIQIRDNSTYKFSYTPNPDGDTGYYRVTPYGVVSNLLQTATSAQYSNKSTLHENFCYVEFNSGKIYWNTEKEYASVADMLADFNGLAFVYYLRVKSTYSFTSDAMKSYNGIMSFMTGPYNNIQATYRANGITSGSVALTEAQLKTLLDIVQKTPIITEQPQSASGDSGETVTFSVAADNVSSYLWQRSTDSSRLEWVDTDGTECSYTYTLPFGTGWIYFRCRLTGPNGLIVYTDEVACRYT